MNCQEAIDVMLEADLDDSAFAGTPSLSEHLRDCVRCRAVSETLVAAEGMLRDELSRAARRGIAPGTGRFVPPASAPPMTIGRRAGGLAAGFAAAAAVASLLLFGDLIPDRMAPSRSPTMDAVSMVEVPEGQTAMIFRTPDPMITVVWIYQGEEHQARPVQ